jgi:hypothetical protein
MTRPAAAQAILSNGFGTSAYQVPPGMVAYPLRSPAPPGTADNFLLAQCQLSRSEPSWESNIKDASKK